MQRFPAGWLPILSQLGHTEHHGPQKQASIKANHELMAMFDWYFMHTWQIYLQIQSHTINVVHLMNIKFEQTQIDGHLVWLTNSIVTCKYKY